MDVHLPGGQFAAALLVIFFAEICYRKKEAIYFFKTIKS